MSNYLKMKITNYLRILVKKKIKLNNVKNKLKKFFKKFFILSTNRLKYIELYFLKYPNKIIQHLKYP